MAEESWDATLTYVRRRDDLFDMFPLDQILEMDDEGSHDFTVSICEDFCDQAEDGIAALERARQISDIGALGNHLDGLAASVGAIRVRDTAQKLKHLGSGKDENNKEVLMRDQALSRAAKLTYGYREQCKETIAILRRLATLGH
ncbi:Phosphorelay intermediate protein [Fusarium chlamydosporum]